MAALVPCTWATYCAVLVATALSVCRKFRQVRSAVSSSRALPLIWTIFWLGSQRPPSGTNHWAWAEGAMRRSTSVTQGWPQITAASRLMMVATAWVAGSMRPAVRSPLPTSSARARSTFSATAEANSVSVMAKLT